LSSFTPAQLEYLGEGRLGRLATADNRGLPQVTPVGMWIYNADLDTVDIGGRDFTATKKYRNVEANHQASLVVDDLASINPWRPRAVMIQGPARAIPDGGTQNNPIIRITPVTVVSWGLD
jgi:pyridoxamine 5'-phosphate oxidase family protein